MRLFIAIRLTSQLKESILDVQDDFRRQQVGGNYTSQENLHLTLAFIGEYGDPDEVLESMESVPFAPFTMRLDRIGCFDALWWAGIAENEDLSALARRLRHALAEAGIPFDRKRFKPHITFLRRAEFRQERKVQATIVPREMRVERISLMQSTRGKNGMIYTELGSVTGKPGSIRDWADER